MTLVLLLLVGVIGLGVLHDPSYISPDTIQHLRSAALMLSGHGFSTDIVYYDVQRLSGSIPTPQTVWPPGFAWSIVASTLVGIPPERAPFLLSMIASASIPLVVYATLICAGSTGALALIAAISSVAIEDAWILALTGASEPLFILATLLAVYCIVRAERTPRCCPWLLAAGAAVSCAVLVRYAGILLLMSAATSYVALAVLYRDWRLVSRLAPLLGLPAAVVAAMFFRNWRLTGSPTGGHLAGAPRGSFVAAAKSSYWALRDLFGVGSDWLPLIAACLIIAALLLLLWPAQRPRRSSLVEIIRQVHLRTVMLAILCLCYCLGTLAFYVIVGISGNPANVIARYFVPAWSCFILLIGAVLTPLMTLPQRVSRRGAVSVLLALACGAFLTSHARSFAKERLLVEPESRYTAVHEALDKPGAGESISAYLARHLLPGEPILTLQEHRVALLLDRPTIGLPDTRFSSQQWTAERVRALLERYRVRFVLFFPAIYRRGDPFGSNLPFFDQLAANETPPWLKSVESRSDVMLLLYEHSSKNR